MLTKIKLTLVTFALFTITSLSALEPLKENRARLSNLHGSLLLPDYSFLDFDMSFDCGSKWETTAMIITSKAGAQLLAASYTHMWGEKAGELVMYNWNNKTHPEDPRLPTFLVVTPPSDSNFDWRKSIKISSSLLTSSLTKSTSDTTLNSTPKTETPSSPMPTLSGTCGTRSHSENGS